MAEIKPFILGIEGLALTEAERELFSQEPPFGIILFLRNIDNPSQLKSLLDEIESITRGKTLLFIDQEGGRVQRLAPPHWPLYPIASHLNSLDDDAFEKAVYAIYRLISDDLVQAGFHVNCAPCLDLRKPYSATFILERSFGAHKSRVIAAGHAAVQAMNDGGIAPVIKHLPGHGRALVDSHLELPHVMFDDDPYDVTPDDVEIFQQKYDVKMAMNAHILYPQIDKKYPLTLSPKGIEFIRKNVGFEGLIMSDDLAMKALNGTQGELARRAFDAGLDVALACSGHFEENQEIYALDIQPNEMVIKTHNDLMQTMANRPDALTKEERAAFLAQIPAHERA